MLTSKWLTDTRLYTKFRLKVLLISFVCLYLPINVICELLYTQPDLYTTEIYCKLQVNNVVIIIIMLFMVSIMKCQLEFPTDHDYHEITSKETLMMTVHAIKH